MFLSKILKQLIWLQFDIKFLVKFDFEVIMQNKYYAELNFWFKNCQLKKKYL
jgi:hypothetical protein